MSANKNARIPNSSEPQEEVTRAELVNNNDCSRKENSRRNSSPAKSKIGEAAPLVDQQESMKPVIKSRTNSFAGTGDKEVSEICSRKASINITKPLQEESMAKDTASASSVKCEQKSVASRKDSVERAVKNQAKISRKSSHCSHKEEDKNSKPVSRKSYLCPPSPQKSRKNSHSSIHDNCQLEPKAEPVQGQVKTKAPKKSKLSMSDIPQRASSRLKKRSEVDLPETTEEKLAKIRQEELSRRKKTKENNKLKAAQQKKEEQEKKQQEKKEKAEKKKLDLENKKAEKKAREESGEKAPKKSKSAVKGSKKSVNSKKAVKASKKGKSSAVKKTKKIVKKGTKKENGQFPAPQVAPLAEDDSAQPSNE